jgi:predicted  nucleic acid-binding Zn-ribbon protein
MSRPTIAGLTAELDRVKERRDAALTEAVGAKRDRDALREDLDAAARQLDDLRAQLTEARYAAAYWLGRAHQATGIPDEVQGTLITDLVARPAFGGTMLGGYAMNPGRRS